MSDGFVTATPNDDHAFPLFGERLGLELADGSRVAVMFDEAHPDTLEGIGIADGRRVTVRWSSIELIIFLDRPAE